MPARAFRLNSRRSSRVVGTVDAADNCSVKSPPEAPAIVTQPKSARTKKQTEIYNPLEENQKPQHKQSTKTPTKENTRSVLRKSEAKEEFLILEPIAKELLCHQCNFGGELMQCYHASIGGKTVREIGCAKLVHPFCVGREEMPKGGWLCTTCSARHGHRVKMPKELRNKDIVDYGFEFSDEEKPDLNLEKRLKEALAEWKRKRNKSVVDKPVWQPSSLFGSLFDNKDIAYDDGDDAAAAEVDADTDSIAHSVGPCDICKEEGELIRCNSRSTDIGCGKGVHIYCVFREEMPKGDWLCEDCARNSRLKLDKKYAAMGYEYSVEDVYEAETETVAETVGSMIPEGEDTFEWNENLGFRIRVGSRIALYDEEDDEYESGTLEYKDMARGVCQMLFDDGERRTVDMRNRRIRLLSDKEQNYEDLKSKMRLSLDPSLPHYIICGGGVTRAHNRKHAHRLLEHYVEVFLDEDITVSLQTGDSGNDILCQEVLAKLKDDGIEFIQWDATIGGFGEASRTEIKKKIESTFEEKREERALMPRGLLEHPLIPVDDDGPILHELLVNGGRPIPKIPQKLASDDPFLVMERLLERHRRHHAWESGIISMQSTSPVPMPFSFSHKPDELDMAISASASIQLSQKEVVDSVWDSDIFDDAKEDKSQERNSAKNARLSLPQRMFQRNLKVHQRKHTMHEIIAQSCGNVKPPPPALAVGVIALSRHKIKPPPPKKAFAARKKRGRSPSAKNSKQPPTFKKLKFAAKRAAYTNSTNRKVRVHDYHFDMWESQFKKAASFRKKHGHCNIPSTYPSDPALAMWAKRQRHQYQLYLRKFDRCTMTPERIEALGKIDFCFDNQQIKWMQRFEELKAYHKKHGHTRVSATNKEDQKLGAWVKHQRAQKKLYDQGLMTFITASRIDMLNSLDFVWQGRHLPSATPPMTSVRFPALEARPAFEWKPTVL